MALTPGRRLGAYDVVSLLGSGGMGEVYRAHDSRLKRDVALKVLQLDNEDARFRFEREARALAALNHPNIVTIHSVEEVDGIPFLTMELVEGEPLSARITPAGLPLDEVLELAVPIGEALSAAHRKGIIHRDLKPGNIMTTSEGHVKILDFGLAKALSLSADAATVDQTMAGITLGTIAYMSPEQARGETLDPRSDLFSFGVVLFELASGRRPFSGETNLSVLASILDRPAPAIGGAHAGLDPILARALAKKPSSRYQRAEELLSDLRALRSGTRLAAATARPSGPSIAVLPFANMSAEPEQEYFCDGMAEELISALARIKGLSVAARTSSFLFKQRTVDIREIGERLMVQTVLEGSVRKMGNRLRVSAQLINAHDGYQIWAERYDSNVDDVFAIQDEIAHAITEALKIALVRPSDEPIVRQSTANLDAYQAYLRGRFFVNRLTGQFEALFAARDAFQEAVTLDPDYAAAYAGLSEAYCSLAYLTFLPTREASEAALAAAHRAVELDPGLAEAHTAVGWTKTLFAIDMATAEQDFVRAIELAPSFAPAHGYYVLLLASLGRFGEALTRAERTRQLDPVWLRGPFNICITLICARQFEKAERVVRDIMALDANLEGTYWFLSSALAGQGRLDEAIAALEKGVPLVYRAPLFVALLGLWYARAGRRSDAEALLEELIAGGRCPPVWFAILYAGLGDLERAIGFLDRAIDEHNDQVCFMMVDHRFDELRAHPRFDSLLARIGLRPAP
jgi:TolB-like protein/tRNA A-37 threonylcarbamoyl transferase component Bud32